MNKQMGIIQILTLCINGFKRENYVKSGISKICHLITTILEVDKKPHILKYKFDLLER